jgi:predicted phage baseplate assembly protein
MPLTAPPLDDRQFADIVAQAKTLIPRYAPEWTNFNESDPGITLVELFAWMTEILLYRLNQVPELNYIKFLQLLGIELEPAQPAKAEVTFAVSNLNVTSVIVPQGTQVAVAGGTGQAIIFETDQSLIAIGAVLAALQSYDGFGYTSQTEKNANPGQWFYPFGQNPAPGGAFLLGFSSPVAFPTDQINLALTIYQDGLTQPIAPCTGGIPPPATIAWEYWNGAQWASIDIDSDGTQAFTQNGHILFPGPGSNVTLAQIGSVPGNFFWIRARLETASYEIAPQIAAIMTNTIGATQAITFNDEVLGGSDGTPNQTFQVTNTPVVVLDTPLQVTNADGTKVTVKSLRLEIDEGQGFIVWQEVDDFFSSGKNDQVFTLDLNTGVVTMGDGDHGRIPVANQANPTGNVVARMYRSGGGSQGNVGPNTITQIQTFVQSISAVKNYDAATGGTDEESVEDAKLRAAAALKSINRAVTPEDFEYLAKQAPGANVSRALALPLFHPDFPSGQIPGVVTVIVVPNSQAPNPTPNQTTLQAVCTYLDAHRLLTSEVYVVGPVYRKIKISVQLVVQVGYDLATVKNAVQSALTNFFDPLTGGSDGTGWPFGGTIYYSDVYRVIFQTPGVQRIQDNQLLIFLDDQIQQFCRDVPINQGELLYNDPLGHDVEVAYATSS